MIEESKVVKTITSKTGGKTGTYWTVTWQDGKSDNVFNTDWLPLLEESQKSGRTVNFVKEQTKDGKYYNVKSMALSALPAQPPIAPQQPQDGQVAALPAQPPIAPQQPQDGQVAALATPAGNGQPAGNGMTKNEWQEKDRVTRKSIERQTALNAAVELAKNSKVEITTADIIRTAHSFEAYLAGVPVEKEVQPAKKTLVEEAKKTGATEIKKGGDATP